MAGFAKKKYFKLAKGFYGRAKNCIRITIPRVEKSLQKAYIGRKLRRRDLRRDWIAAINAGSREHGLTYSRLICGLNRSNINLDRKILSNLAMYEPYSFKAIVDEIRVQSEQIGVQRQYKLEEMIRRNLITSAQLQAEDYEQKRKTTIKMRYRVGEPQELPDDYLQKMYKSKNV